MDRVTLSLILTGVVCGCCVILCIVVTYLCVVVKRVRRKLNDLSGDGTKHLVRDNKKSKDVEKRISGRYTGEPQVGPQRAPSAVYQDPQETVTVMEREAGPAVHPSSIFPQASLESSSSTQNITEKAEQINLQTLQFVNEGFNADCARDSITERSSVAGDSQPIYDNQEVFADEPIYENNNDEDETIYQNTGELRDINNPEWARSSTLSISQIT